MFPELTLWYLLGLMAVGGLLGYAITRVARQYIKGYPQDVILSFMLGVTLFGEVFYCFAENNPMGMATLVGLVIAPWVVTLLIVKPLNDRLMLPGIPVYVISFLVIQAGFVVFKLPQMITRLLI